MIFSISKFFYLFRYCNIILMMTLQRSKHVAMLKGYRRLVLSPALFLFNFIYLFIPSYICCFARESAQCKMASGFVILLDALWIRRLSLRPGTVSL